MTGPAKDFASAGMDIPVTPEEDEYFQQLERTAEPPSAKEPARAMSFDEYELHCKMLRQGAFPPHSKP